MLKTDRFEGFIGQDRAKSVLNFVLDIHAATGYLTPITISAPKGAGKTEICKRICQNLAKKSVTINATSIDTVETLVEQVLKPHVINSDVSVHFDESHSLRNNPRVEDFMLSVIAPSKEGINRVFHNGEELVFDNSRVSWLFSTTELQKHSDPFLSRTRKIAFEPYKQSEIAQIIEANTPKIKLQTEALEKLASVSRDTPRQGVMLSKDVVSFCGMRNINYLSFQDCLEFLKRLSINSYGLDENETAYLKLLTKHGRLTLSALSNSLEFTRPMVQRSIEPFLIKKRLVTINSSLRSITNEGRNFVASL